MEVVGLWYVGCGSSRVMSGSSRVMRIGTCRLKVDGISILIQVHLF